MSLWEKALELALPAPLSHVERDRAVTGLCNSRHMGGSAGECVECRQWRGNLFHEGKSQHHSLCRCLWDGNTSKPLESEIFMRWVVA